MKIASQIRDSTQASYHNKRNKITPFKWVKALKAEISKLKSEHNIYFLAITNKSTNHL